MTNDTEFDLMGFLPYVTAQAADVLSLEFQRTYKGKYAMLRTEWRVLFHLGYYGDLTASDICNRARLHKTKVSRAVAALENKRFLARSEVAQDRRQSTLRLTRRGEAVFADLHKEAQAYDARIRAQMTAEEAEILKRCLRRIAGLTQTEKEGLQ